MRILLASADWQCFLKQLLPQVKLGPAHLPAVAHEKRAFGFDQLLLLVLHVAPQWLTCFICQAAT